MFFFNKDWSMNRRHLGRSIAIVTFGILALELALIRWTSSQVRIFAYFNNMVLICAFLGMGAGVTLGQRKPWLANLALPTLLIISVPIALAPELGITSMRFPDSFMSLWGGDAETRLGWRFFGTLSVFLSLLSGIVATFVFCGTYLGALFSRLRTLKAYGFDLLGSLMGVLGFSLLTLFGAGPGAWLALSVAPFIFLLRTSLSLACGILVVALSWYSGSTAIFSPYNRIDLDQAPDSKEIVLSVNRDFHQFMHDLSDARLQSMDSSPELRQRESLIRYIYDFPFKVGGGGKSAIVVGAGTGNDVQAALRNGFEKIISVDIDPVIIHLGQVMHPEKPYDSPKVVPVVDDARAFFEYYDGPPVDVVCYGLLDSHAMFSSMSSLRLDNYVYTVEGIRSAWKHVDKNGVLTVSFSVFAGPWIFDRLYWTIAEATGYAPIAMYHGMHYGATFVVPRDPTTVNIAKFMKFGITYPSKPRAETITTSDNWPFLYLKPGHFPFGYIAVLTCILIGAVGLVYFSYGRSELSSGFDLPLFLMGAAFLLLETRGVTSVSLLFGSTWIVNSAIFGGILLVILIANSMVDRFAIINVTPWFYLLFAATLFVALFNNIWLVQLPFYLRGMVGALVNALPIGIAGFIVPSLLNRAKSATAALGSNLLGSVVGGCLEYLSTVIGLRSLALMSLGLYVMAFLIFKRRNSIPTAGAVKNQAVPHSGLPG